MMFQLAFDIREHSAYTEPEEFGVEPGWSELFFH